ncbi:MAG: hypothetical protein IJE81_03005 [Oscillospiraceae bacterium]|nr:hypothetical protein [Oscillospiraceae bacterium]MBQ7129844.1 hypothetical protein [Oscillospiraceae bacterium]
MKLIEKWKALQIWQKAAIILRDIPLFAVLLSAPAHIIWDFDNSVLVLICLPLACVSQAVLSWRENRKLSLFFLFAALFVIVMYWISAAA